MSKKPAGVLAVYKHIDCAVDSIGALKEKGYKDFTVFSPAPNHELEEAIGHRNSPVRLWTLFGGLTGLAAGFAMTLWMSYDFPIVVGGKPIGSIPPYIVIAFELTILIGALSTLAGLAFHIIRSRQTAAFDPRCSDDMIGIFVPCPVERRPAIEEMLRNAGAEEVKIEA